MSNPAKIKVEWFSSDGEKHEAQISSGQDAALLDLCEAEGVALPFGCRVGSCGSCRVQVVAGEGLLAERTFLEQDTLGRHRDGVEIRLACRVKLKDPAKCSTQTLVIKPGPKTHFKG